jgi:hypothetical protein
LYTAIAAGFDHRIQVFGGGTHRLHFGLPVSFLGRDEKAKGSPWRWPTKEGGSWLQKNDGLEKSVQFHIYRVPLRFFLLLLPVVVIVLPGLLGRDAET